MASHQHKPIEPGITKRGKTYYVRYRNVAGVQKFKTAKTLRDARRIRAEHILKPEQVEEPVNKIPFAAFAQEWFESRSETLAESTISNYRLSVRYACEFFGDTKVGVITRRMVRDYVKQLEATPVMGPRGIRKPKLRSYKTISGYLTVLKLIFDHAVEQGLAANPALGVRPQKRRNLEIVDASETSNSDARATKRAVSSSDDMGGGLHGGRVLSEEQVLMLPQLVPERFRAIFMLLPRTGLRVSEMLGLQVRAWDPDTRVITVERQYIGGKFKPVLKTKNSYRRIQVHPNTAIYLNMHLLEVQRRFSPNQPLPPEFPIFPSPQLRDGLPRPYDRATIIGQFSAVAGELGAPWATQHALRHYCASVLIESKENPLNQIARYLGHTVAVLLNTYSHWLGDELEVIPDALGVPLSDPCGVSK